MGQVFTDKLSDVIYMLQLAHKTGLLSVEHVGVRNSSEQGTISFVNGQITQASTGAYQGARALEKLQTWEDCRFTFHHGDDQSPHQQVSEMHNGTHNGTYTALPVLPTAPYRVQEIDQSRFTSMGFSRLHWHLFLLVDGQRSTLQLAHLLGRSLQETISLLFELERAHLIQR